MENNAITEIESINDKLQITMAGRSNKVEVSPDFYVLCKGRGFIRAHQMQKGDIFFQYQKEPPISLPASQKSEE